MSCPRTQRQTGIGRDLNVLGKPVRVLANITCVSLTESDLVQQRLNRQVWLRPSIHLGLMLHKDARLLSHLDLPHFTNTSLITFHTDKHLTSFSLFPPRYSGPGRSVLRGKRLHTNQVMREHTHMRHNFLLCGDTARPNWGHGGPQQWEESGGVKGGGGCQWK